MKRLITIILALALALSLFACGGGEVGKGELQAASSEMSIPSNAENSTPAEGTAPQAAASGGDTSAQAGSDAEFFENFSDADAWSRLAGYWNGPEGQFVCFSTSQAGMCFEYGLWGTSFSTGTGVVSAFSLRSADLGQYGVSADFPAVPANEMDDAREAFSKTFGLDLFDLERDGKIKVDVDGFWEVYAYGGATAQEAYDTYFANTSGDIAPEDAPEQAQSDAVLILDTSGVWSELTGYWTAAEGRCIGFGFDGDAKTFEEIIFETEFGYTGTIFELSEAGTNLFEAVGRNADDRHFTVQLDVGGLEKDGKINVKIDDGSWYTYAYGGATAQDAYASLF